MTDDRAQTPHDYAIGVSLFLVTLIGVFAFVQGSVAGVYTSGITGADRERAERVGRYIVDEYSAAGERNALDVGALQNDLTALDAFKTTVGLDVSGDRYADPNLNVTIVESATLKQGKRTPATVDIDADTADETLRWGDRYARMENTASTIRVITLAGSYPSDPCESGCWLIVRVW